MRSSNPNNRAELELQPAHLLWQYYTPQKAKYRFSAQNIQQAKLWQRKTVKALEKTIGFQDIVKSPLAPKLLERVDKGDYVREKILIRTSPYSVMPVYILIPKKIARPLPSVMALHGHGYGVKDIVGLWQDGRERNTPEGYQKDFAVALCRRGFAVAAPEISCFGERETDFSYVKTEICQQVPRTCIHTSMLALHLGGSAIGLRVFDAKRLIDYLEKRKEFDTTRLGAMGISGGGVHAFFSAAVDRRIRACVISGGFCTFKDSIFAVEHCLCNVVPRLHEFGEMYDLIGLIAPRPVLIESGDYDPVFPRQAVKKAVKRAKDVYKVFNAVQNLQTDYYEGRHQISGQKAYDFLMEKLV